MTAAALQHLQHLPGGAPPETDDLDAVDPGAWPDLLPDGLSPAASGLVS